MKPVPKAEFEENLSEQYFRFCVFRPDPTHIVASGFSTMYVCHISLRGALIVLVAQAAIYITISDLFQKR